MIKPKNQPKIIEENKIKNINQDYRLKLDKNENIYGASSYAVSALRNFDYEKINLYPDYNEYIDKFAKFFGINKEKLLFFSDIDSILYLILNTYLEENDEFLCSKISENKIEIYADFNKAKIKYIELNENYEYDIEKIKEQINENTKICCFSSPNNITGHTLRASNIAKLLKEFPDTLFIVDISLVDYIFGVNFKDFTDLIDYFSNIILIKTYSSAFALAGNNIGVAVSKKENIKILKTLQPDYQITEFSFKALLSALNDEKYINKIKEENKEAKEALFKGLNDLGFTAYKNEGNFILCDFGSYQDFYFNKLKNNKIIVKNFNASTFLNCLRITAPKLSGVKLLLKLLEKKDIIAFALEDTLVSNEKQIIEEDILEELSKNYDLILVSNKTEEEIAFELEKYDIKKYFSYIKSKNKEIKTILTDCPYKNLALVVSNNEILSMAKKVNIKSIALVNDDNNNNLTINNFKHFGSNNIIFKQELLKYFNIAD